MNIYYTFMVVHEYCRHCFLAPLWQYNRRQILTLNSVYLLACQQQPLQCRAGNAFDWLGQWLAEVWLYCLAHSCYHNDWAQLAWGNVNLAEDVGSWNAGSQHSYRQAIPTIVCSNCSHNKEGKRRMRAETNELSTKTIDYIFRCSLEVSFPSHLSFSLSFCLLSDLPFLWAFFLTVHLSPLSLFHIYMYPLYPPFSPYLYAPINPLPLSKVLALIFTFKYSLKGVCMCWYNMQIECVHCLPKSPIVWMGLSSGFSLP